MKESCIYVLYIKFLDTNEIKKMDKDKTSFMLRGTSCVGEPGSNALAAMEAGDLTYFVDTLNREDFQGDLKFNLLSKQRQTCQIIAKNLKITSIVARLLNILNFEIGTKERH